MSAKLILMTLLPLLATASPYPVTPTTDQVDDFFGTRVADPYRWLEDVDSARTAAWVGTQNRVTFDFLATLPKREAIRQRLLELMNHPRYSLPRKMGGRYFYTYNTGLQNQSPLYVKDDLAVEGRIIVDPNGLAADGTTAITTYVASDDGRWLGYGIARAGSDWNEFRVRDLATGEDTGDVVQWVKFSNLRWTKDGKGFFYSRYPEPRQDGNQVFTELANHSIYYHRLGTPQADDVLVYARPDEPQWNLSANLTEDGRYLLITVNEGTDTRNRLHFADLQDPLQPDLKSEVIRLIDVLEADYTVIGNDGPVLLVQTDLEAPRGKIIAIDLTRPDRASWRTLVPETDGVIKSSRHVGGRLLVNYMQDACSRLALFARDGKVLGDIPLPGIGTVESVSGREDEGELFFDFTSFTYPTTNFRTDLATGKTAVFQAPQVAFDPAIYETKQVFYPSKDGTKVPMFITHRKGLKLDGSTPTMLYGYGGFNISLTPWFSTGNLAWLELGGVYAVPNLRGGGEYGKAWHQAGTKERKQNVFDDFIAAGEFLIREGYTSSSKLVLFGGSNGGLLVGAVINQRPDLARVAFPAVGVMDMLRFHRFTIGWAWASDYGSAEDPEGFKYLSAYSPLHNVKPGTDYPAVMVMTADHDDRVHPGHSFKYAAAMQAANPNPKYPTFIRIDVNAGHGAGKPISKQVEETADRLAFALHFTGTGSG